MPLEPADLAQIGQLLTERRHDPFRPLLQFLVGLITFCLGILVGVFAALPKEGQKLIPISEAMLGGVLTFISISALAATRAAYRTAIARMARAESGFVKGLLWFIGFVAVAFGAVAVAYCVRGGLQLLGSSD
ncbi:MAG: hypothetical protein ACREFU_07440 [Acetobacteraceae bacterium]